MKKVISFVLMVSLLLCLCACGVSSKFTGTWHGTTKSEQDCTLTIKSNQKYILQVGDYVPLTGECEELNDYTIILSHSGMLGANNITCTLKGDVMHITGSFEWKSAELYKD